MAAYSSSSYPLAIVPVTGFDKDTYPYLLVKDDNDIILVDIKNFKSYVLFKDQDFNYPYDWMDTEYYDWGMNIL